LLPVHVVLVQLQLLLLLLPLDRISRVDGLLGCLRLCRRIITKPAAAAAAARLP
jgi:hypothetical protein